MALTGDEDYHQYILKLGQESQKTLNLALQSFEEVDPRLQPRLLIRLRSEATNNLDSLKMPAQRKSYLLHQLANCHDMEKLITLLREINHSQLSEAIATSTNTPDAHIPDLDQDLLLVIHTSRGFMLAKQSFTLSRGFHPASESILDHPVIVVVDRETALLQIASENGNVKDEFAICSIQHTLKALSTHGIKFAGLDRSVSELTQKGLLLDPYGIKITNGDDLLCGLVAQHALKCLKQKNILPATACLGVIGIHDLNIATTTMLLADHVKRIIIFHHSPVELSPKIQLILHRLFSEISGSEEESAIVEVIRHHWNQSKDVLHVLSAPLIREFFHVTSDLTLISEAQLMVSIPCSLFQLLSSDRLRSLPVQIDLEAAFKVNHGEQLLGLAQAELSLLPGMNTINVRSRKHHISHLVEAAQLQGFRLF